MRSQTSDRLLLAIGILVVSLCYCGEFSPALAFTVQSKLLIRLVSGSEISRYLVDSSSGSVDPMGEVKEKAAAREAIGAILNAESKRQEIAKREYETLQTRLSQKANHVEWSPDRKRLIAFTDNPVSTVPVREILLVDSADWRTVASYSTKSYIVDFVWSADSSFLVILEREYLRNSLSPWGLVSSIFGHPVALYQFRAVVLSTQDGKVQRRVDIDNGPYHTADISWAPN